MDDYKLKDRSNAAMDRMIKKNVMQRQALKKKWDKACKYSAETLPAEATGKLEFAGKASDVSLEGSNDNFVRLLDEGVVVEGDGSVYAVIKKGVIKKWYDSLPDDFVGNIDKDHNRSLDLGTFTKKNLKLIELGDGRYGVDVDVKLDDELYAVRDLKRMGNKKAISSEFWSEENEFIKQSVITGSKKSVYGYDYLVPLIDEIQITGYAVVDSPKNANSYDEDLLKKASTEKDVTMTKEELRKLAAEGDEEATAKLAELEAEEATADAEEATDDAEESSVEGDTETEAEETEGEETDASAGPGLVGDAADEAPAEEADAETEDATDEEAEEEKSEEEVAEKFETAIKELRAQIAEKDAKIAELEAKLSAKTKSKNAFMEKLESMLDFTTAAETGEDEGNADTTPEKTEGDEIADEYAAAFKDLN